MDGEWDGAASTVVADDHQNPKMTERDILCWFMLL